MGGGRGEEERGCHGRKAGGRVDVSGGSRVGKIYLVCICALAPFVSCSATRVATAFFVSHCCDFGS